MAAEAVRFDEVTRSSMSDQPVPAGGVPRALRMIGESAGLDVTAELYNEALTYASEGHLRAARERLQVLLALAPEDGEARLVLAKVDVAGQRWQGALASLDEAASYGVEVPKELRRAVEDNLRAEDAADQEQRDAVRAREHGENKALRQEARRLRSENAQLSGRILESEGEARKWAWTTAGVSVLAILFIAANLVLGGSSDPAPFNELADANAVVAPVVADAAMDEVVLDEPVTPVTLAERARVAIEEDPALDGAALEITVQGLAAVVSGEVMSHDQLKAAGAAIRSVDGIDTVDTDGIVNVARTRGTTHRVQRNDTLGGIASHYYGDSTLHTRILEANRHQLRSATAMQIGQELIIPSVD